MNVGLVRFSLWRLAPLLFLAGLAAAFVACGDGGPRAEERTPPTLLPTFRTPPPTDTPLATIAPPPSGPNLFNNPSFEEGGAPWFSLRTEAWGTPFSVSDRQAQSGARSALLELRADAGEQSPAKVYGVVQEVAPEQFPEELSGYYYVERWEKGTPKQYLQFVVIVFGGNVPEDAELATNYQIRYVLAGVDEPPLEIGNAKYVLVNTEAPQVGQWVPFKRNLREDFQRLWGQIPQGYERLRILFEVRWDERPPDADPSAADVFFDDLYLGPATE